MNKELKRAILEVIKRYTVKYDYNREMRGLKSTDLVAVHSYRIKGPQYSLQFNCEVQQKPNSGYRYSIYYDDNPLVKEQYVSQGIAPVSSALAVDVLEIWNAAQEKYHAQQRAKQMTDIQKTALENILADLVYLR